MIGRACLFTAADKSPSALLEPPCGRFVCASSKPLHPSTIPTPPPPGSATQMSAYCPSAFFLRLALLAASGTSEPVFLRQRTNRRSGCGRGRVFAGSETAGRRRLNSGGRRHDEGPVDYAPGPLDSNARLFPETCFNFWPRQIRHRPARSIERG